MDRGTGQPPMAGRQYHFNVIYNHARCPLSATEDTQLSLAWTQTAVQLLERHGLGSSYYHDRDCPQGQGLAQELSRVVRDSQTTLVLLSPAFVRDCWPRYWLLSSFRSLFTSSSTSSSSSGFTSSSTLSSTSLTANSRTTLSPRISSPSSSSSKAPDGGSGVVVVGLGLHKEDLPAVLQDMDVVFFPRNWQCDPGAWRCLGTAFRLKSLAAEGLGERREENHTGSSNSPLQSSLSGHSPRTHTDHTLSTSLQSSLNAHSPRTHTDHTPSTSLQSSLSAYSPRTYTGQTLSTSLQSSLNAYSPRTHTGHTLSTSPRPPSSRSSGTDRPHRHRDVRVSEDSAVCTDDTDEAAGDDRNNELGKNTVGVFGKQKHQQRYRRDLAVGESQTKKEGQAAKEEGRCGVGPDTGDMESAVLDRLCGTGLRRESVEENSITRVFVHGNTVAIDTLRSKPSCERQGSPRSPRVAEHRGRDSRYLPERCEEKHIGSVSTTTSGKNSDINFSHHGTIGGVRGALKGQDSMGSSGDEVASTQSPRRKLHYTEEYGSPADTSFSISLTTQHCETPVSAQRSAKREVVSEDRMTARMWRVAEESPRTPRSVVSSLESPASNSRHSAIAARHFQSSHTSSAPGSDQADSTVTLTSIKQSKFVSEKSGEYAQISSSTNHQVSQQTLDPKDVSPMKNCGQDSVYLSTENTWKNNKENGHYQPPQTDTKLLVLESKSPGKELERTVSRKGVQAPARTEVEETMFRKKTEETTFQNNFITSIEDDHEMTMADLCESWRSSDYSTVSPRHDLSTVSQDSGFLSSGLASFGLTTPRTPRSTSDSHDHHQPSDNDTHVQTSDPKVTDKSTKPFRQEDTTYDTGFLEKSSMTKTSFGCEGSSPRSKVSHNGDTFDGSSEVSCSRSVTLEQTSAENSPQSVNSLALEKPGEDGSGNRELHDSPEQCVVSDRMTKTEVITKTMSARAQFSSKANTSHKLSRKDSWIYVDLDKGWNMSGMLLPLYRVMCYVLSRPEMPYF